MTQSFSTELPNKGPRPEEELEALERIWATPKGFRLVTAVNNTVIGTLYIGAAFLFFVLAGILALLMRTQLAVAENDFLSQDLYNQIFTVLGTTMMFLFAVRAGEAMGVMLLPKMKAARGSWLASSRRYQVDRSKPCAVIPVPATDWGA